MCGDLDFVGEGGEGKHISLAAIFEGKHISLVICVRGHTYHGETHITVTPPSSPEYLLKTPEHPLSQNIEEARLKKTFEVMEEVDKSAGPRLKVKRAGAVAKNCLDVLKDRQYVTIKSEYIRI